MSDDLSGVVYRAEINRLIATNEELQIRIERLSESLEESRHREANLWRHVERLVSQHEVGPARFDRRLLDALRCALDGATSTGDK